MSVKLSLLHHVKKKPSNTRVKTSGPKKASTTRLFRTVQKEFQCVESSMSKSGQGMQTDIKCFQILVKKQFEKQSFGRPRKRWGIILKEISMERCKEPTEDCLQ
jgi:hypothetical protein